MPLGIRQLVIDRADEIRKPEGGERDAGDIVLLCQRLEALPVEDRKIERGEIPGEPVRAGVVRGRTLGEHEGDQNFLRQGSDYLRLDCFETLVAGPDAVQAEMNAGFVISHLLPDLMEIRVRYTPCLYTQLDARSVVHGDRKIRAIIALNAPSDGRTNAGGGNLLAEDRIDQRTFSDPDATGQHDIELGFSTPRLREALPEKFLEVELLVALRFISKQAGGRSIHRGSLSQLLTRWAAFGRRRRKSTMDHLLDRLNVLAITFLSSGLRCSSTTTS